MEELRELTGVIELLNQAESFAETANRLTQWVRRYTGCRATMLRFVEEGVDGRWLAGCAFDGSSPSFARDETLIDASECICGRVASETTDNRQPFYTSGGSFVWGSAGTLLEDFTAEQTGELRGRCIREQSETLAVFPLRARSKVVGLLHVADPRRDHFQGEVEVVESVCRLVGDILIRHQDRERERALLEAVQAALLPADPGPTRGLTVGVSFGSATEMAMLGGDFYDVVDLGASGTMLLVGDVAGKGLDAAGIAAQTRYALTGLARETSDPASFMAAANEALCRSLQPERFIAAVCCLVDPSTGHVTTCLAGHPSPLRFSNKTTTEIDAPRNPPLGLFPNLPFSESTDQLAAGDVLLIYTDGVCDSRRGFQEFGAEGIVRAAGDVLRDDPKAIASRVCSAARAYHDSSIPSDDRLVMAVRLDQVH